MSYIAYMDFRLIADGMLITMIVYALLSYYKNKNIAFLYYSLTLFIGEWAFYIADLSYKKDIYNTLGHTFEAELNNTATIIYFLFTIKIFEIRLKDKVFNKIYRTLIILTAFFTIIPAGFKLAGYYDFVLYLYRVESFIVSPILLFGYYRVYRLKFTFVKYFLFGSVILALLWNVKCNLQISPEYSSYNYANAFTFPNTYGQLGLIIDAVFIFVGLSELNKITDSEIIENKQKLLSSLEVNNTNQLVLLKLQENMFQKINNTIEGLLSVSLKFTQQAKNMIINKSQYTEVKSKLYAINELSYRVSQAIREVIRELDDSAEVSNAKRKIEEKVYELTRGILQTPNTIFDLYLNDSEYWILLTQYNEKTILLIYQNLLQALSNHKQSLHLIVNFIINPQEGIGIILQDDGLPFISKTKFLKELDFIEQQITNSDGKLEYFIEDQFESIIRIDMPIKQYAQKVEL